MRCFEKQNFITGEHCHLPVPLDNGSQLFELHDDEKSSECSGIMKAENVVRRMKITIPVTLLSLAVGPRNTVQQVSARVVLCFIK